MKKSILFVRTSVLAALYILMLCFVSCSGNTIRKTKISISVPKDVIERVLDEAAREGSATADQECSVVAFLYVDGWADPNSGNFKSIDRINYSNIEDVTFTFPDIYIDARIQAQIIVSCGSVSYSGWSSEMTLTEEGAELEVEITKDKRLVTVASGIGEKITSLNLAAPSEGADSYGNEYWEFTLPEEAQGYSCTWYIDEIRQDETSDTLRIYKALTTKGEHTISFAGKNGNKRCTGERIVDIVKEDNRYEFISTDKGLEFRINRLQNDERFDGIFIKELTTNIQIDAEMRSDMTGWTGLWPFVEKGQYYTFELNGNWGQLNPNTNDDYWKKKIITVCYEGNSNTPLSETDKEYLKILQNYAKNKNYTATEKRVNVDGAQETHVFLTINESEKKEISNMFKASGGNAIRISLDMQFVFTKPNNPQDLTDGYYEVWFGGLGDYILDPGRKHSEYSDYDIIAHMNEDEQLNFKDYLATEIGDSDYELRVNFFYKLKGMSNQTFKIECTNEANDYKNIKVTRLGN